MRNRIRLGESVHRCTRSTAAKSPSRFFPLVVLFLLFFSSLLAQERSLKVVFENDPSRIIPLGSIQRNGVLYASLNGIAETLSLRATANQRAQSLEIKTSFQQITFFADNAFVAIANHANDKTAIQLSANVISSANDFYIPLAACTPAFEKLFGVIATFDKTTNTLRISKQARSKPTFDIPTLALEPKANGMLIRVSATRPLADFEGLLKQDGWLYVTIPKAKADIKELDKIKPAGAVKKIIATQFPTSVQLAFRLEGKFTSSDIMKDETSNDLLISIHAVPDETKGVIEEKKKSNVHAGLDRQRKKYGMDVIVLDAGHGGKDPGTIGVAGTKEKNVALGIVLKLGKLIKKNLKGLKVVYTRDDDTFVELDRRGQIANEADGKLFISVHCNSMPRKPYPRRGFEVYLLRPGRTDEAIAIAERENSVIELEEGYEQRYQKLTDDNFILVTMAQTAHMKASETFADFTAKELDKVLDIPNNGVTQAGFLVLVGSAMPNVLIETAYLSNREDEKLLKSESGQQQYAEAIFNAIKRYKKEYEKLLLEGKELGETKREE